MGSIKHINSEMNGIGKCYYCERTFGVAVYGTCTVLFRTRDHIIPVNKNGNSRQSNLIPCCDQCNQMKSDRFPEEFLEYLKNRIDKYKSKNLNEVYPIEVLDRMLQNTEILCDKIAPIREHLFKGSKQIKNADAKASKKKNKLIVLHESLKLRKQNEIISEKTKSEINNGFQETVTKLLVERKVYQLVAFDGLEYMLVGFSKANNKAVYFNHTERKIVIQQKYGNQRAGLRGYEFERLVGTIDYIPEKQHLMSVIEFSIKHEKDPEPNFHYED